MCVNVCTLLNQTKALFSSILPDTPQPNAKNHIQINLIKIVKRNCQMCERGSIVESQEKGVFHK